MNNIAIRKRHSKDVYVNLKMEKLKNLESMCLNCRRIKYCGWAAKLHKMCKETSLIVMVIGCPILMEGK